MGAVHGETVIWGGEKVRLYLLRVTRVLFRCRSHIIYLASLFTAAQVSSDNNR